MTYFRLKINCPSCKIALWLFGILISPQNKYNQKQKMNLRELRSYLRKNELEDQWWIQVEGKILEYPVRIADIIMRKGNLKNKQVAVRHASEFPNPEDIEVWESIEFTDGFVLRTQKPSILSEPILKQPMQSLEAFKEQTSHHTPEDLIEGIYEQLNKERNSLMEIERKLETIREELAAKEQELIYREEYIEQCEDLLANKANKQEEREAELDQVLENLKMS